MALGAIRDWAGLNANEWPPRAVRDLWEEIDVLAALRDSDDVSLRAQAAALGMSGTHATYVTLPIPRLISRVKANLLFGQAPRIDPPSPQDRDALDYLLEENDLAAELHRAAVIASSEGEVWGKVTVAPGVIDAPIIEFVSRRQVLPRFAGRFPVGGTFVREIRDQSRRSRTVWRILEDHTAGMILTTLYAGDETHLGTREPLRSRPETADLLSGADQVSETAAVVQTGVDRPLLVFIPNTLDADPTRGISDYLGVVAAFFALNETATTGQSNVRLTARKRLFVRGTYLNSRGNFPADNDVFRSDQLIDEASASGVPIAEAQYTFQAAELVAWQEHLVDLTLTLAGVAPQSVGRGDAGRATSGTALKLKMTHTLMEAAGSGRYFDRGVRRLLSMAAQLDASEFGRPWRDAMTLCAFHRGDGLPDDPNETATELQALDAASAISTEEKVRKLHPDWTDEQVTAEVEKITGETAPIATAVAGGSSAIPTPPPAVVLGGQSGAAESTTTGGSAR